MNSNYGLECHRCNRKGAQSSDFACLSVEEWQLFLRGRADDRDSEGTPMMMGVLCHPCYDELCRMMQSWWIEKAGEDSLPPLEVKQVGGGRFDEQVRASS